MQTRSAFTMVTRSAVTLIGEVVVTMVTRSAKCYYDLSEW